MGNFMNNDILSKANELISYIGESDTYLRYQELVKRVKSNDEIMTLIKEIKFLQKEAVRLEYNNKDKSDIDQKINIKLKKLEEYPIYVEMNYLQEDLNNTLCIIRERLNNYIDEQIN